MKVKFLLFLLLSFSFLSFSQNNALLLNGAYMVLNGGSSATPIYLVVNQTNIAGITRSSGHIVSESQYNFVQWNCGTGVGTYTFSFGIGATAADYIPFVFDKTTAGNADIGVSTWATNQQNMPHPGISNVAAVCCMTGNGDSVTSAIDRFWDIRSSAAATGHLTFSYKGTENTTSVPGDPFKAQHWNGSGWDAPAGPGDAGVTGATIGRVGPVNNQSTFSPWVLTRATAILPVELLQFSAQCNNGDVEVKWSTASEQNNDFFTVYRSPDGLNYQPLGIVDGPIGGNSSSIRNYFFTDSDPLDGTSYYRLSQTDFDGATKTFPPISVSCKSSSGFSVIINNPAGHGNIWISVNGATQPVLVSVRDVLGRQFYSHLISDPSGSFLFNADLGTRLASGIYIVSTSSEDKIFSKKILIVK